MAPITRTSGSAFECSPPLRAVLDAAEVAALLAVPRRTFAQRCRVGEEPAARRGFNATGFIFDWRDVDAIVRERLSGEALYEAQRRLLGIRAGSLEAWADTGEFIVQKARPRASTDEYEDDQLHSIVTDAAADLGPEICRASQVDLWLENGGFPFRHGDMMVRFGLATWPTVLRSVGLEDESSTSSDLANPEDALHLAAEYIGDPSGTDLTAVAFDSWAEAAGSPLRAHQLRRLFDSWNAAKASAGLSTQSPVAERKQLPLTASVNPQNGGD